MQKSINIDENSSFLVHLQHILMMIIITLISLMKFNNITSPPTFSCDHYISYNLLMLCEKSFNFTDTSFLLFLAFLLSLGEIDNKSFKFLLSTHFTLTQSENGEDERKILYTRDLTNALRRFLHLSHSSRSQIL